MLETIFNHRSIRKYKDTPVSDDILNKILEAGTRASTTGNMQLYSIIVTRDTEEKKKLWEYHFKQNMVLQAPVLLTFLADINRFNKWCFQRDAQPCYDNFLWFTNALIDATLAAQNAALAAEHFGLGICYLGTTTYQADKLIEFFNCPKGVVPVTTLVIGYPDESPELTDRLPMDGIVHHGKYDDYSMNKINQIFAEKESLPLTKKLLEENKLDNLAKIFTQKRYPAKDNLSFSKKFLEIIHKQGFMNND